MRLSLWKEGVIAAGVQHLWNFVGSRVGKSTKLTTYRQKFTSPNENEIGLELHTYYEGSKFLSEWTDSSDEDLFPPLRLL